MLGRICFLLIVLFWTIMNAWLWRSEFRGKNQLGSSVPIESVWQKILTAPDDSALEISRQGRKIGFCRWRANVGEELITGKFTTDEYEPEGQVKQLSGYTIDLEGSLVPDDSIGRIRFELHGGFGANHLWKELTARAAIRPQLWEIKVDASDQSVRLTSDDGAGRWEQQLPLADLRDPTKLLNSLGLSFPLSLVGLSAASLNPQALSLGLIWEARMDWFNIGHSKVRVYRLQARLLDRYEVIVIVSRVGEIFRVELPGEIVLMNESIVNL